jgi:hypothetical protein
MHGTIKCSCLFKISKDVLLNYRQVGLSYPGDRMPDNIYTKFPCAFHNTIYIFYILLPFLKNFTN